MKTTFNHCHNCDCEAVGFYETVKGAEFNLCQSCLDAFELGQVNADAAFCGFHDEQTSCGGDECCGCEVSVKDCLCQFGPVTPRLLERVANDWQATDNADDDERQDRPCDADCARRLANDDSVECTCSRSDANQDFATDDGQRISVSICATDLKQLRDTVRPWQADNDHDSAKAGIEVETEALDLEPQDKTTVEYLMFQELDLECTGYKFIECPWDSCVGYECMKVLRKAREFIDMLHDLDSHQDIWSAAFEQCDVFYCG